MSQIVRDVLVVTPKKISAREVNWKNKACPDDLDPEDFHRDEMEKYDATATRRALQVCQGCEIRLPCQEYAIENREFGVWGATTTRERAEIIKKRKERAA